MSKKELSEIKVEVSRDQLSAVLKAMSPFRGEDNIRLTFIPSNLVFEAEELGVTGKITIGNESVTDDMVGTQMFLSKGVLNQIYSNMPNTSTFVFKNDGNTWSEFTVNIAGDLINIGLPIFDKVINTDYTPAKSETILSEVFDRALGRVEASLVSNSSPLGCVHISKQLKFGSGRSLSIYRELAKEIDVKVSPDFRRYMSAIFKVGGNTEVIVTEDGSVVFKSENVEYKTSPVSHTIPDLSSILDPESVSEFICGLENLKASLNRLAIPLAGSDMSVTLSITGDKLKLEVFDLQGRKSESEIALVSYKGEGTCRVSINDLRQVIGVMEQDAVIKLRKADDDEVVMLELSDKLQDLYLSTEV